MSLILVSFLTYLSCLLLWFVGFLFLVFVGFFSFCFCFVFCWFFGGGVVTLNGCVLFISYMRVHSQGTSIWIGLEVQENNQSDPWWIDAYLLNYQYFNVESELRFYYICINLVLNKNVLRIPFTVNVFC